MATESRPVPKTAMTAAKYIAAQMQASINELARQVVADLGYAESDNWRVDFDTGVMTRVVPDVPDVPSEPVESAA